MNDLSDCESCQLYYWTQIWQEGEREALDELARGEGVEFATGREAIAWLLTDD